LLATWVSPKALPGDHRYGKGEGVHGTGHTTGPADPGAAGKRCPCPTADAGSGECCPPVMPQRLSGALLEHTDRRQRSAAMPEGQLGQALTELPSGGRRHRGRSRAPSARGIAERTCSGTRSATRHDATRAGGDDAPRLWRRFPRLLPGLAIGRGQGTEMPCRPPGKPVTALPRGSDVGAWRQVAR
jgi:hypothetical protein